MLLNGSVTPWVLGTLGFLVLVTSINAFKAWRSMKRSPYFFMRRQAEKRLQTYSFASFGLVLAMMFVGTYTWQTPVDDLQRVALLPNTKPPKPEVTAIVAESEAELIPSEALINEESDDFATTVNTFESPSLEELLPEEEEAELPEEFNQFDPTAELAVNTNLGTLQFSTEVSDEYAPVQPRRIFPEGSYTIYATFDYEEMADGMEWAWIWRHNGEVRSGGNELWAYGDDGPGYVYLNPEEGFQSGEYTVEVWVNSELLTQSSIIVNNAAVTAGN